MSFITDYSVILNDRMKKIVPITSPTVVTEYTKYTNKVDWNQYTYTMTGVGGLGMGQIIADGAVPLSDAPIQGFTKSANQVILTERERLSQQSMYYLFNSKDGAKIDAEVKKKVLSLQNAITHLKNYYAQSIIANGWATSFTFTPINSIGATGVTVDTTGADGVATWSLVHPREDGGATWSNIIVSGSNNPVFSFTALLAARALHVLKKDARGLPLTGSNLNLFMFQNQSTSFFLAQSIKRTLESGKYPSATPGTTGTFVDGNPTDSYEIFGLTPYGGTGITSVMWFGLDSTQVNEYEGFQYIESMPMTIDDWAIDYVGNRDYLSTATAYAQIAGNDFRYWMVSNGTAS